ncbi:hypothetical protein SALBM311S_00887 [Streptomyces alboniger]
MPRAAAARSFARTATSRRPVRLRRTLATTSVAARNSTSTTEAYRCGWSTPEMLIPKRVCLPTAMPSLPVVVDRSVFWKTIASSVVPRPSVMIARLTPRVRTAGSANSRPIGTVPNTPASRASSKGQPQSAAV